MKQLTILAPECLAMICGIRWIDNRSRMFHYRGRVIIHVSPRKPTSSHVMAFSELPIIKRNRKLLELKEVPLGVAIGTIELVDCMHSSEYFNCEHFSKSQIPFVGNKHLLIFDNPIWFKKPFEMKGKLNLCDASPADIAKAKRLERLARS